MWFPLVCLGILWGHFGQSEARRRPTRKSLHQGTCKVREPSVCMMDEADHFPGHLAEVLGDPQRYLVGPKAHLVGKRREYVIVGAGIAGLTAAYLLLTIGHKVTIIESSKRVGGRIYTARGDGYYGDIGAMRFPQDHELVMKAFKLFDVPTAEFTTYDEGPEGNFYFINGKYMQSTALRDQKVLRQLYADFGVKEDNIPKNETGFYMDPRQIFDRAIGGEVMGVSHCRGDETLHAFLRNHADAQGWGEEVVLMWATFTANHGFLSYSVDEYITDSDNKALRPPEYGMRSRLEVVNGSDVLPHKVLAKCQEFPAFKIIMSSPVRKISDRKRKVLVYHGSRRRPKVVAGDRVLVATTARAVSLIQFTRPLPLRKTQALKNIKYMNANKIFLKFKTPFWAYKENNRAAPILYHENNGEKVGGTGITDNHLSQIYYPSHAFHGPVLLVSYTWDHNADFWLSLNASAAKDLALQELSLVHGPVVWKEFEQAMVYNWNRNPHSHGAFVMHETYQKYNFMDHLMSSYGKVMFAGEYANKEHNGWVEAAMQSAVRVLVNDDPRKFNEAFRKEELAFLNRKGRFFPKKSR